MCLGSDFLGCLDNAPITNANFLHLGRGLSLPRVFRRAIQIPHLISENVDVLPKRGLWPPHQIYLNLALRSQSEVYLRALREYFNQRQGFLWEGWSGDFFYCQNRRRRAAAEDDNKVFCNLLGKTLNPDDEWLLGSPASVSRPLDFGVIDFRLAAGAYAGSHEAFLEDVCEMWNNICSIYVDQSHLVELVEKLSRKFKDMYDKEVGSDTRSSTLPVIDSVLTSVGDELSAVEEAISSVESEHEKMSIRKDFLGRDSAGRVYWGFGKPGTCSLLVDGSLEIPSEDYMNMCYTHAGRAPTSGWISFQSDGEISEIVEWLSGGEARDVELRESILQWQRSKRKEGNISRNGKGPESSKLPASSDCRFTRAAAILMKRYGPSLGLNLGDRSRGQTQNGKFPLEGAMYCCECLELIWTSKHHCFLSHKTHPSREELENHYDRNFINRAEEEGRKEKKFAPGPSTKKLPDSSTSDQVQQQVKGNGQELINKIDDQTQVAEDKNGDSSTLPVCDSDLTSVRDELSAVEEAISSVESELEKMSIRKDFLGRDSAGRVYWGFGRPGTCSLLVDGSLEIPSEDYMNMGYTHASRAPTSGWISFQSDGEISEIVEWLRGGEATDLELRESILQWQKSKAKEENISRNGKGPESSKLPASSDCRFTKAATVLEKRYGPSLGLNLGDRSKGQTQNGKFPLEGAMYRCDCLELIWPSKHHCFLCHKTHPSSEELDKHYDRNCINRAEEEARKGKKIAPEPQTKKRPDEKRVGKGSKGKNTISVAKSKTQDSDCPHDFKEISSKFVTQNSLRELVRGIGLIGSSGIPSFIPGPLSYVDDTALRLAPINEEFKSGNGSKDSGDMPHQSREGTSNSNNFPWRFGNDRGESTSKVNIPYHNDYRSDFPIRRHRGSAGGDSRCVIPESSLRRLVSRESAILRQLKMNLLDMEAALPDEAVRPSMAQPERRSAWSSFVKSAGSIYEMVQATIVLENMIRADYLRREWWYWSSLTAAANISTLLALALRLSTLEAAIMYERPPPAADSTEVSGLDNKENEPTPPKSDKGKEKASPSKKSDSPKRKGKANKRRKDSGK